MYIHIALKPALIATFLSIFYPFSEALTCSELPSASSRLDHIRGLAEAAAEARVQSKKRKMEEREESGGETNKRRKASSTYYDDILRNSRAGEIGLNEEGKRALALPM